MSRRHSPKCFLRSSEICFRTISKSFPWIISWQSVHQTIFLGIPQKYCPMHSMKLCLKHCPRQSPNHSQWHFSKHCPWHSSRCSEKHFPRPSSRHSSNHYQKHLGKHSAKHFLKYSKSISRDASRSIPQAIHALCFKFIRSSFCQSSIPTSSWIYIFKAIIFTYVHCYYQFVSKIIICYLLFTIFICIWNLSFVLFNEIINTFSITWIC